MGDTREFQGTPGPWEYGGVAGVALTFDAEVNVFPPSAEKTGGYQYGGPVAVVSVGEDAGGEANAWLIAAAPDLLRAVRALLSVHVECVDPRALQGEAAEAETWARAAIDKALGRAV
jgi:hypothetical protein